MKLLIDEFTSDIRLDSFLSERCIESGFSRSKIQTEIKKGTVLVNGKNVKPSYLLKEGDIVEFEPKDESKILPENIPLDIIWEDENIVIINKPSGMLTHPTSTEKTGTLVNALLYRYGDNLSDINGEYRRGILHRLDRNTSGLLIVAKNNSSHEYLAEAMKEGRIIKKYLAIVKGNVIKDEFTIDKPIMRNPEQPHKMMVKEGGKSSVSIVKVLKRFNDATLLEIRIITGRTHQIRVHMSAIGHPVYNDTLYGFGKMKIKTEEQVLESYKLSLPKPFDGEMLSFEIAPDEKFKKVLKFLKSQAGENTRG